MIGVEWVFFSDFQTQTFVPDHHDHFPLCLFSHEMNWLHCSNFFAALVHPDQAPSKVLQLFH
jgi:hypothetical protein